MFNGEFFGITIVENVHLSSTIRTFMCDCWWNTQPQLDQRTGWQFQQIIHVSALTLNLALHKSYQHQCFSHDAFTSYLLCHYGNQGHTTDMWHWTAAAHSQLCHKLQMITILMNLVTNELSGRIDWIFEMDNLAFTVIRYYTPGFISFFNIHVTLSSEYRKQHMYQNFYKVHYAIIIRMIYYCNIQRIAMSP